MIWTHWTLSLSFAAITCTVSDNTDIPSIRQSLWNVPILSLTVYLHPHHCPFAQVAQISFSSLRTLSCWASRNIHPRTFSKSIKPIVRMFRIFARIAHIAYFTYPSIPLKFSLSQFSTFSLSHHHLYLRNEKSMCYWSACLQKVWQKMRPGGGLWVRFSLG